MGNETQIYKYIQLDELDDVFRKVYNLIRKKANKRDIIEFYNLVTNYFSYFQELQIKINEIDKKIKDLHIGYDLLFKQKYVFANKFYSRTEFNLYHIEFFFINLIALFDRFLHLINFLYELNIRDKNLKNVKTLEKEAKKQNKLIDPEIINFLNTIYNKINETNIRQIQNQIKHKQKYYDHRMYKIDLVDFISLYQQDEEKEIFKYFGFREYKEYRKILRRELEILIEFSKNAANTLIALLSEKIKKELTKRYLKNEII